MSRRLGTILVLTLFSLSLQVAPALQAAEADFTVFAGAVQDPEKAYEYTRYYPEDLRVHRGQTIRWQLKGYSSLSGFHSVTFAAGGDTARPTMIRPDETGFALQERWAFGSGCGHSYDPEPVCGLTAQAAGGFVSSGAPLPGGGGDFRVRIGDDLPNGEYRYFCTIHPSMAGTLEVVDDPEAAGVPTPDGVLQSKAQIDAWVASQIQEDTAAADRLVEQHESSPLPPEPTPEGKLRWTVLVGDSTANDHVAIDQYLPSSLDVEPGDQVRFVLPGGVVDEVHTVSFPAPLVDAAGTGIPPLSLANHPIMCDLDEPETGQPGIPGPWAPALFLPCPGNFEIGAEGLMPIVAPGGVVSPATVHHSGWLVPPDAPETHRGRPAGSGQYFGSSFDATFPVAGDFTFMCEIHSTPMSGSIRVS